uniref:Uncharacterized protein n=1 Tax=Arundo donax TaxID=35708 RepID=A0A0A9TUM4_ARUDO
MIGYSNRGKTILIATYRTHVHQNVTSCKLNA